MRINSYSAAFFMVLATLVALAPVVAQVAPPRGIDSLEIWGAKPLPGQSTFSTLSDTSLPARLQAALTATYNLTPSYDKHGVAASVIVPGYAQWSGAAGTSDGVTPMSQNLSFEIGSCTKTFIAALILQLRDEGKLSLTDSIHKFLPAYPNVDSTITIVQLLDHSSGLYDYLNDDPAQQLLVDAYINDPTKIWTPQEILDSFVGAENFKPGKGYRYSNTDFLLLGLIADSVTHNSASAEIHSRFLSKLVLTHTLCSWEDSIPTNFPHNYSAYNPTIQSSVDYYSIDKTAQLTEANTAGGMVSVPAELARWSQALYTGQILSPATTAQMLNPSSFRMLTDGFLYNLGTMLEGRAVDGQLIYGHFGSMIGFVTGMATIPHDSITVVVYVNSLTDTVIAAQYISALLHEIQPSPNSVVAPQPPITEAVQVYPNPVRNHALISFDQTSPGESSLTLYDELGNAVRVVSDESKELGPHQLAFETAGLPNGAYFYRLQMSSSTKTGALLVSQ
ncbi:MAG TPA: serine hydrolase [Candidatus Kapabacteria bacterium]|nr:serine hydrolase [Candidatus Kapabacteria bacterium]